MLRTIAGAVALGLMLAGPAAMADPPAHAGGGKGKGGPPAHAGGSARGGPPGHVKGGPPSAGYDHRHDGRYERRDGGWRHGARGGGSGDVSITVNFGERDDVVVRDYYSDLRHCPPGLAKKNNGCMPPGQAKKWRVGHVLPPDVIYYDLPPELVVRLSPTSAGYKYVRVGADILKIAVGTGLIVDAIEDLGRL